MSEITDFGTIVLAVSATVFVALLGMRLADRISVPYAALFLVAVPLVAAAVPTLQDEVSIRNVERLAVVAIALILFDGGLHIGLRRFRSSAAPILALGIVGTFLTAGAIAVAAHYVLGFEWIFAGLIGAAIAPTDPAVTFSVFGAREVRGRSGTILQGEAGVNDPVGIALMIGMIELAESDDGSLWIVAEEFAVEMVVGLVVGIAGAIALLPVMRRIPTHRTRAVPDPGSGRRRHRLRARGDPGWLRVSRGLRRRHRPRRPCRATQGRDRVVLVVDRRPRRDRRVRRPRPDGERGRPGRRGCLVRRSGARRAACVRRAAAGGPPTSRPRPADTGGSACSSSGAASAARVPILLGALALLAAVDDASRLYGLVFIVVLFSVVVQGTSVPLAAARLRIPFRRVDHDLAEVLEFVVRDDAFANGRRLRELPLGERAWVGVVIRNGVPSG